VNIPEHGSGVFVEHASIGRQYVLKSEMDELGRVNNRISIEKNSVRIHTRRSLCRWRNYFI
jgi:hypothetical protein